MREECRKHYLKTGTYTYAGPYREYFQSLPDDIPALCSLVCSQVIHRVTLKDGNTNANKNLQYGDMERYPWYRMRCEDDIFLTAIAMTGELFRYDDRGFQLDRKVEHKLVVTCRYVAVLMAAILKAKGIPSRCRAGFAPYFSPLNSGDHWITQYYNEQEQRWVSIDADGFYDEKELGFSPYDIPKENFDWSADTWLGIRKGELDGSRFTFADGWGTNSLQAVIRYLCYDFHAIMNNELIYSMQPSFFDRKFDQLTEEDFRELDYLAECMLAPDENFDELKYIWEHKKKYRIINSPLVGDYDNNIIRDC